MLQKSTSKGKRGCKHKSPTLKAGVLELKIIVARISEAELVIALVAQISKVLEP